MKVSLNRLRRSALASIALAFAAVGILPAFMGSASAYGQVQARYIQMSSSANGATGVSYEVGFEIATTGVVEGVVVDFCASSPIIGDACTLPSGFSVGTPTVATSGGTNTGLAGVWTAASINTGRTLTLKNSSGGSISAAVPIVFTLSTATNPTTTNTSFYARIFTFDADTDIDTWDDTVNGSATADVVDAGGIALSTVAQILVTAKVQETLTFCVYTGANCIAGGTGVNLGDTNNVLSSGGQFVDVTTKYDLASNAAAGVTVRMKGTLPTSGSNDINTIGTTATVPVNGTELFGLCTYYSTGSGSLLPVAPYDDATCSAATQTSGGPATGGVNGADFAFDTAAAASTYGDDLATMAAADTTSGVIAFVGGSAVTTPAGIYTTNLNFIATGIY